MLTAIEVISSEDSGMTIPEPGLRRQVMSYTKDIMLVRHKMENGWVGAKHQHPHEQMVYVVKGHLAFEYPAGRFEFKTGDSFIVPGNTDHQAFALEESEVLDIFTPSREDYASKAL